MTQLEIRVATAEDVPAIMEIETDVFASHAWSTDNMLRDVTDSNCVYLVAYAHTDALGGEPHLAGYAGILSAPGAGEADIQTIAVNPQFRSAGLGRTLMAELLEVASHRRAKQVFLEVRADNDHAIALYESLGFVSVGVRAKYYQPEGVDALLMKYEVKHD